MKRRLAGAIREKQKHPDISWIELSRNWGLSDKTIKKYWTHQINPQFAPRRNEHFLALGSDHFEQRIIQVLLYLSDAGTPLNSREVRRLAGDLARDVGVLAPDANLSSKWLWGFKKRRPVIAARMAETLSALRNKASSTELQLRLGQVLNRLFLEHNIISTSQIASFDELHLDSSGRLGKRLQVLARKGARNVRLPSGPTEGSGQACTVVAGGTAQFSFSVLILVKVLHS